MNFFSKSLMMVMLKSGIRADNERILCDVAQPWWLGTLQSGIKAQVSTLSLHGPFSRVQK
jgi:hypothetical protein